jgi:RNA polymerase sigma factor (sigma-70 family)
MPPTGDRYRAQPDADRPFECCFRDNYAAILAFAIRRVPDRGAAEDAAAETFAVAWRRRELIPAEPLPWLYGIALRVIANQRRSTRRRRRLNDRLERETTTQAPAPEPIEALQNRDAFSRAFALLSETEREVLRLIAWDGLETREAAGVLGCSPTAFRVRLHRARRRLAKHLEAAGHLQFEGPPQPTEPAEEAV